MNHYVAYNIEEIYTAEDETPGHELNTFLGWLESSKSDRFGKRMLVKQQRQLIENFIAKDPKIQPVKGALQDAVLDQEDKEPKLKTADYIVSETLAKIYYQQRKYQLAIETYEKLSLVYPEKSAYFARLIDKIEKETDNS